MGVLVDTLALVGRYAARGVLMDANLLVGFLIGNFDPRQLKNCRATKNFSEAEFALLTGLLPANVRLVTTPHVLTKVSNLAGRLPANVLVDFRDHLALFITKTRESSRPAAQMAADVAFRRFGLTDTAMAQVAAGEFLVITDDTPLYHLLLERKVDVVNFNHLRKAT